MAYSEVFKNFNRIRDYMREFYVYGFKSRDEYTKKSARSYDDERRRIESLLGDYMQFRQSSDGKNVFISIDSRMSYHNPLYKAWKAKSFTDGDITLHFLLMDILPCEGTGLTLYDIEKKIDEYLEAFITPRTYDESTIRKKLKEYEMEGIVITCKEGRKVKYKRSKMETFDYYDVLDFFSEVSPCGVIGSFLLDKLKEHKELIAFKHHYITGALDSEILCDILSAIQEHNGLKIESIKHNSSNVIEQCVIPLQIMVSVQNGRQYLMAYSLKNNRITPFRLDNIVSVKTEDYVEDYDRYSEMLEGMLPHIWGVSTQSYFDKRMEHIEFTVHYENDEQYIHKRLEREKRCGLVEKIDNNNSKFSANVYDAYEVVPWIRTFICRISDIQCSNKELENIFKDDIRQMYELYGINGGENS